MLHPEKRNSDAAVQAFQKLTDPEKTTLLEYLEVMTCSMFDSIVELQKTVRELQASTSQDSTVEVRILSKIRRLGPPPARLHQSTRLPRL